PPDPNDPNAPPQPGGGQGGQQQSNPLQSVEKFTPGNVAKAGQPPSPKPMGLPKFPIASSRYNARQIAMMPINQVTDVFKATGLRAGEFLAQMDDQEPGILQYLSDEVKQFFSTQLRKEQARKKPVDPKRLARWSKELAVKARKWNQRTNNMAEYLNDLGKSGRPGAGSMPTSTSGKPGTLGPSPRV